MTSILQEYTLREQDVEHIERLREVRESGVAMETDEELKAALLAQFGEPEATETFEWATEDKNAMYYSDVWTIEGILDGDYPKMVTLNS